VRIFSLCAARTPFSLSVTYPGGGKIDSPVVGVENFKGKRRGRRESEREGAADCGSGDDFKSTIYADVANEVDERWHCQQQQQ